MAAEVRLRFYGRFILAEPRSGGLVNFLAPNMNFRNSADRPFRYHHASLTMPRSAVSDQTTLRPTVRMMSDRDANVAESFLWDLAGCQVKVPPVDKFSLTLDDPIPDVAVLEQMRGRAARLDPSSLTPSEDGKTNAVIEVAAGQGRAVAAFPNMSNYVTRPDAEDDDPDNDQLIGAAEQHADVTEFVITVTSPDGLLRLEVIKGTDSQFIVIDTQKFRRLDPGGVLRVSITSLCPTLPEAPEYDHEFGQYYELLTRAADDRLIPKKVPTAGAEGDCNDPSRITYDG